MATKKKAPVNAHDLDRIIVRLPEGMREKIAELADGNGRSLTAEVVAALEKHLKDVDRFQQLNLFIEEYSEDVQGIPDLHQRLKKLEDTVSSMGETLMGMLRERPR